MLTQRGEIEILISEPNLHEVQKESELIFSIGNLVCRCLDFGLNELDICEVRFQDDMAELIGGMYSIVTIILSKLRYLFKLHRYTPLCHLNNTVAMFLFLRENP